MKSQFTFTVLLFSLCLKVLYSQNDYYGLPIYADLQSFTCFTESEIEDLDDTLLSDTTLTQIRQQDLSRLGLVVGDWGIFIHSYESYIYTYSLVVLPNYILKQKYIKTTNDFRITSIRSSNYNERDV